MFTHNARTGHGLGSTARRAGGLVTAFAVGTGLALVGGGAASAAEVPTSYAQAQFLSGSLLGGDLADVVALEGAEAYNDGTQDKVTSKDPLNATALDAINIDVPGGVQVESLSDYVDAGAVNQYAEADRDGKSMAAAGAIRDDGGIGAGAVGSGAAGDVDLDLSNLADGQYEELLTDLRLSLEAVAAQAVGNLDTASGDYTLDGATLNLTSPAIAGLTDRVLAALGVVDDELGSLSGSGGILALDLGEVLDTLGLVADPVVSVKLTSDIEAAVRPLLVGSYSTTGASFNLETGTIEIDLATLHGGDLNNLPPNTELIDGALLDVVFKNITDRIDSLIDSIVTRVDETLRQAQLDVDVDLDLLTPVTGLVEQCGEELVDVIGPVGATVQQVLDGVVGGTVDGVSNGLVAGLVPGGLGDLLGGILGGGDTTQILPTEVVGQTLKTVCELVNQVVDNLQTSVHVDVHGTVQQVVAGQAPSSASATVLGVPVEVPLADILSGLVGNLNTTLLDPNDGAVQQVLDALNLGLLEPALDGLLGDGLIGEDVLGLDLTDILSVLVNVQERFVVGGSGLAVTQPGSYFTETAVRVSTLGGGLAVLNIAAATVGPNISRVVDPEDPDCTVNCGPGGPGGPGDPGGPGSSASGTGNLAMTGVGIATLVAVILALLAAGAYLAREGYRRNHPQAL